MSPSFASPDRIDLVILDIEMPKVNGLEVLQAVRTGQAGAPDVPVIVLTGHGDEKFVKASVLLGVHGFIVKPVSVTTLKTRIRVALKSGPIDPATVRL